MHRIDPLSSERSHQESGHGFSSPKVHKSDSDSLSKSFGSFREVHVYAYAYHSVLRYAYRTVGHQ